MAATRFDVFVGAETGLLKGINVLKQNWDNLNSLETADKANEICSLCWSDRDNGVLCMGLRNHVVKQYDTKSNKFLESYVLGDCDGKLRSLVAFEDRFVTATDSGRVYCWKDRNTSLLVDTKTNLHFSDSDLHCMVQNPQQKNIISTGGKENDLKLWDLNNMTQPIFQAKNVRNDWLNLRVRIWVMGTCFLQENKVVTCTGYHQVRVYDYKGERRRPVLDMEFDEYPITAMSVVPSNDNQVVVGNTQGRMALLDLRKTGRLVHVFKGFAGGIRSIECHTTKPVVASCGLDRFLRVHDIESKALLYKMYLKSRLNCVALTQRWGEDEETTTEIETTKSDSLEKENDSVYEETDDIWDKMEVVKTRTVRKPAQTSIHMDTTGQKKRKSNVFDLKNSKKSRSARKLKQ